MQLEELCNRFTGIDELLSYIEGCLDEMHLAVHGVYDGSVRWVAPHLREGAPQFSGEALVEARAAAIFAAHTQLLDAAGVAHVDGMPPLEPPTDEDEGPEPLHGDSGL